MERQLILMEPYLFLQVRLPNGPTDIDGILSITSTGVYDADGTFTAANGNITFSGAGFLNLSNTVQI